MKSKYLRFFYYLQKWQKLTFLSLVVILLFQAQAIRAEPHIEILKSSGEKIDWPYESQWVFAEEKSEGDEKGSALFLKMTLHLPSNKKIKKAKIKFGQVAVSSDQTRLELLTPSLRNTVGLLFMDHEKLFIKMSVQMTQTEVQEKTCRKHKLKLELIDLKDPIFAGMNCQQKGDELDITISFPQGVEWQTSTLFEVAGKGERWKKYRYKQMDIANKTGEMGKFTLRRGTEILTARLVSLNQTGVQQEFTSFRVSGLVGQFEMKTETHAPRAMEPGLRFEASTRPFVWRLGALIDIVTAFPLGSESQKQSFLEFTGFLGWIPLSRRNFYILPLLGYDSLSQDQSQRGISFKHSNVAYGVIIAQPTRQGAEWSSSFWASGLLPSGSSSNLAFDVKYTWPQQGQSSWLTSVTHRQQSFVDKSHNRSTFHQTFLAVGKKF